MRLDRLTTRSAVPIIEGFGSSYEKARSAIEAMLLHYPDRPLTVVFEPHTFSWRNRSSSPRHSGRSSRTPSAKRSDYKISS